MRLTLVDPRGDGLHFDDKLQFVEEPIEITDREVKRMKQSLIPLVQGLIEHQEEVHEFTWNVKYQSGKKYPPSFTKLHPSSRAE
ncbi:hypothetical protein Tco_0617377 [Tanacetum coccineum]